MNITELDQYNLSDAVKFNQTLNPRLWDDREQMRPEVREALLRIAEDFREFLGVDDLQLKDITVSGSNAAYTYTPGSDIDLHLVVDMPEQNADVYQELFNAKKFQYNNEHDIKIGNADVELYVQPSGQPHHSQGIFSIKNNQWQSVPQRRKIAIDDQCVIHKTEDLQQRIDSAIESGSQETMQRLWDKIKNMRQTGLESAGEFGCDNLVFKMLRKSGHIEQLKQAKLSAHDQALSLDERRRKKSKVKYGWGSFGGYWYPGTAYAGQDQPAGSEGSESVKESVDTESAPRLRVSLEQIVSEFVAAIQQELGIQKLPTIKLRRDPEWTRRNGSFGRYDPDANVLYVATAGRHVLDVLRTLAHELTHRRQDELENIPDWGGETGSRFEDEANAMAGRIMRHLADRHPEYFADIELVEGASGYIPKNKKEARMPQYAMALSVDIKPGQTGTEANKLGLKTGPNGEPGLLMKSTNLLKEYQESKQPRRNNPDLNDPLGPETPPTMPAGTVRVDVSDMYDWYKLGQHISNMKGLGRHDFGKGPPSSIFSFGSEELEHKYIDALKKTGLTTTDIDPKDPNQPPGMPRQKTDPTYNVAEAVGNFLYHGSESANISGPLRTSERDSGWFGSGFYLTAYPEYAKRWGQFVYQTPWPKGNYAMVTVIGNYDKITFDKHGQVANDYAGGTEGWIRDEDAWSAKFREFLVKNRFVGIRVAFDNKPDVEVVIFDPNAAGVKLTRADQKPTAVAEAGRIQYKEIEFVCANPQFPNATDPELQQQMYVELTKIPGVIPLWQDQSDYSAGQASLTAIYKDRASRQQIMKLAKQLGVKIDLEQPVSDSYVDRAIRGEHEGQRDVAESNGQSQYVTRIDSQPIKDFASNLRSYKHTPDWSQSGLETDDDSYWQAKKINPMTTKGLFAGDPRRTALYATGNAHETRYVEFTQNGQPIVYFDKKDLPKIRQRQAWLSVFDAANFRKLPTGEWFSDNPGQPIKQQQIKDPFQYIRDQGWVIRVTDNLEKTFDQVKKLHQQGKIAQYGAEGMSESLAEADAARTAKSAIDQTEVFGVRGYRARCLEPGCEWHSRSYDRIKQAQDSAKKHAAAHINPGVAEGSVHNRFMQRLGRKLQQLGYTQTGTGTWSQGPDGRYVNITPLPDGQYGWELRRVNRRGKWYSGVDTSKAVVAIFKEYDIFSKHPVDESLAEDKLVESLRQEFALLEDEFIGEIKMSPSNLRAEAAQTGARAGMEFEMIVPGARRSNFNDVALDFMNAIGMDSVAVGEYHGSGGYEQWDGSGWTDVRQDDYSDDPEMEPDYDQDESCRSIDDAVQFFHDGDYNGHREVQRLREKMENDFQEWLTERIDRDWDSDGEDFVRDWVAENVDDSEWRDLVDDDTTEQEAFDEFASNVHADPNNDYHQSALDEYREENYGNYDESDWLDAEDLDRMSAIESAYDIRWPYYIIVGQDDNVDPKKPSNIYTVEPDGSLAPNNRVIVGADGKQYKTYRNQSGQAEADKQFLNRWQGRMKKQDPDYVDQDYRVVEYNESETGLEFVSPPLPIDKLFDDLKKIRAWAKKNKITTNDSTGLHINVSVPEFSNDKLDYVKLALLLGDQYVLDQFGRSSNTYTKSALGIVKDRVRKNPNTAQAMLDKMREHMKDLATKAIHSGETDKYTSINTKEGYIEFRSPGGDWLDENFDKVENTLLRFTVALKAAMDPEAYREEYLKKLYKLLEPTAKDQKGSDTVRYFADYVAGKIPAAALRSFVKQAQLQRRIAKEPASGKQYWWRVYKDGRDARNTAMIEVVASSEQEAIDKAAAEFGVFSSEYKAYMDAVVLRPYVETETEYEIFQVAGNRVVQTFRAADNDAALAYFDRTISAGDRPYYDVRRAGTGTAQPAAQQPAGGFEFELSQTDIENRLGLPDQTGDANYEVFNRNTQRPVFVFIANTDAEASRKYSDWLAASGLPNDTEDYGFRERARPGSTLDLQRTRARQTSDQQQGGLVDVAADAGQNANQNRQFTGVWLILDPEGDVIHSFAGVGNVQSDANRVAMDWLRQNPGSMQAGVTVVPEMI